MENKDTRTAFRISPRSNWWSEIPISALSLALHAQHLFAFILVLQRWLGGGGEARPDLVVAQIEITKDWT
jgi:hypothetical protein